MISFLVFILFSYGWWFQSGGSLPRSVKALCRLPQTTLTLIFFYMSLSYCTRSRGGVQDIVPCLRMEPSRAPALGAQTHRLPVRFHREGDQGGVPRSPYL